MCNNLYIELCFKHLCTISLQYPPYCLMLNYHFMNLCDEGLGGLCIWSQDQGIHWQRRAPADDLSSCKWERKSDMVGQASLLMGKSEGRCVCCLLVWLKIVTKTWQPKEHPAVALERSPVSPNDVPCVPPTWSHPRACPPVLLSHGAKQQQPNLAMQKCLTLHLHNALLSDQRLKFGLRPAKFRATHVSSQEISQIFIGIEYNQPFFVSIPVYIYPICKHMRMYIIIYTNRYNVYMNSFKRSKQVMDWTAWVRGSISAFHCAFKAESEHIFFHLALYCWGVN